MCVGIVYLWREISGVPCLQRLRQTRAHSPALTRPPQPLFALSFRPVQGCPLPASIAFISLTLQYCPMYAKN